MLEGNKILEIFPPITFEEFEERFHREENLGDGSTAYVFKAYDRLNDIYVAAKQLKSDIVRYQTQYPLR